MVATLPWSIWCSFKSFSLRWIPHHQLSFSWAERMRKNKTCSITCTLHYSAPTISSRYSASNCHRKHNATSVHSSMTHTLTMVTGGAIPESADIRWLAFFFISSSCNQPRSKLHTAVCQQRLFPKGTWWEGCKHFDRTGKMPKLPVTKGAARLLQMWCVSLGQQSSSFLSGLWLEGQTAKWNKWQQLQLPQ